MNRGDLAELISDKWYRLDKATKDKYEELYRKNFDKYKNDVEDFEKKYGKGQ